MKHTIKTLTAVAALSFTISFATGLSASIMYQEHQSLKPIIAAQETIIETKAIDVLYAEASDDSNVF